MTSKARSPPSKHFDAQPLHYAATPCPTATREVPMNSPKRADSAIHDDEFNDEFSSYLDEAKKDPQFRASYEDAHARSTLLDCLVKIRKAFRLSQSEVARRMGVSQPTVSGFENEGSDPRLSTLQRYARAVEARINVKVEMPADCDWVSPSTTFYARTYTVEVRTTTQHSHGGNLAKKWAAGNIARNKVWLAA